MANELQSYEWIVIVGGFVAFFVAYGIGANDVANAFATSVGSGAITIKQAIVIAAVFEFCGAYFLGNSVTDTVRKKIIDASAFERNPEILMYLNLCALAATGIWLITASYFELPVSTTHSIIGGLIGGGLAASSSGAVVWHASDNTFPFFSGVSSVVASWGISPLCSLVIAALIFIMVRVIVLRSENSFNRLWMFFPVLVFLTVTINAFFIIFKGATRFTGDIEIGTGIWIAVVCGAAAGLLIIPVSFQLKGTTEQIFEAKQKAMEAKEAAKEAALAENGPDKPGDASIPTALGAGQKVIGTVFQGLNKDVHAVIDQDARVHGIHDNQERFDPKTEEGFKYLQVFTAIADSFSHGANDVANSIAPFATIYGLYRDGEIAKKTEVPEWILAFGGIGIVCGLATYGYNIIRAIGVKMVAMTASRGFAIELGAAFVIAIGSYYGLPLSTTHCQVGATIGVGLLEGVNHGVNWVLMTKVFLGWIVTLAAVGLMSAAFFAQGGFAPSVQQADVINDMEDAIYAQAQVALGLCGAAPAAAAAQCTALNVSAAAVLNDDGEILGAIDIGEFSRIVEGVTAVMQSL